MKLDKVFPDPTFEELAADAERYAPPPPETRVRRPKEPKAPTPQPQRAAAP